MDNQRQAPYQMTVDSSGRIVIPAEARERHRIHEGDVVMGFEDARGLIICSLDEVLAQSAAYFKAITPQGTLLSDEINSDRRAENERG